MSTWLTECYCLLKARGVCMSLCVCVCVCVCMGGGGGGGEHGREILP